MNPNPVGWVEIYVQDMDRAKAFYESVFQVTLEPLPVPTTPDGELCDGEMEMWTFPMTDTDYGAPCALIQMAGAPSAAGGTLVYFSCDDCADEAGRAAANGGAIFRDKMSIGKYGFIAAVTDSEGNMIGLHSRV